MLGQVARMLFSAVLLLLGSVATAAPTVTLTAPANNSLYHAPAAITVRANASAPAPDTVARVEFYANGNLIGTDTTAAYTFAWNGVVAGVYTLTAKAIDNNNVETVSAPFTVTISDTNTPPTVTLSAPANNAKYLTPATITVSASATAPEANGSVSKIEFFANGNLIGTDTTSPFSISWTGAVAGTYALTAVATDQLGATTTSAARTVVIVDTNTPPTVSLSAPANAAVYVNPASITVSASAAAGGETNDALAKVEFFANGNLIGTDTTSPYSIAWASPAPGTYALTAKATDNAGGETTSAIRTITVNATNTPPTVTLTSPPANAHYVLPVNVTLTATAAAPETNDTVAKVEFFANGALVATVNVAPYTFSWVNPPAATYVLTAVATDALGGTTTSAARTITVASTHTPPTVTLSAPANAAVYVNPASITVSASAASGDTNVTLTKVDFYANGNLIGTDTAAAFSIAWASPPPGTYSLTAKVTDSLGTETTSAPRTITVNATNTPPTVTLTSPPANAHYVLPVNVTLTATSAAPETNDTVAKVEFFANGALIATVNAVPYTFSWVNPPAGTYAVTAIATDALGGATTSAARTITVASTHTPPTVTLSAPANAAVYVNPASITVSATAASGDTNVTLTKVDFYANGNLIGTDTTSPYSIAWASPASGSYALTAKVTDSLGTETTSAVRTITVNGTNTPPTVTLTAPPANAHYVLPVSVTLSATAAAPETNDTVAKVEFFANGTLVATVTAAPYTFSWANPAAGVYAITAVATDALGGTTTSAPRSITIAGTHTPPTVTLSAPANAAVYVNPASITVSASAVTGDTNVTLTKVEFYANGNLIGTDLAAAFSIAWANPAPGTYALTAKVTDSLGTETTSAPRTITVNGTNTPPTVTLSAPANNAKYVTPATITVSATAAAPETNDTVTKVDFFANGVLIGTDTTSPFSISWTPAAGTYTLTAVATDGLAGTTTSAARTVVVSDTNAPPTVSLSAPANNARYLNPANITISATASPPEANNTVTKVDFYANGNLIGTDTTSPYSFVWASPVAGTYALTAKATDNLGAESTSAVRTVIVSDTNLPPTAALTAPANNAHFTAPANFTIRATATSPETNDMVAKVEFFANGSLVGTVTTSPYNFSWTNVAAGTYVLTAKSTDGQGASTTSAARTVVVDAAPTISLTATPPTGVAPANILLTANPADTDGTITKVDFFQGAVLIATVNAPGPYTYTVNNLAAGSYAFTARATDNSGLTTTSAPANVTLTVNQPPTVSITAPANNATFVAAATINITANPADADGTIAKVELYNNATLIATLTGAPYTFSLTNVPVGSYALTAIATDNLGATTASTAVNVTVNANQAPTVSLTAPTNNAIFTAPATITLTATANDTDGTIASVEFLSGINVIATLTSAPYTFDWTNVGVGGYTLTARATDDKGGQTTSAPITVTVNAASATIFYIYPDHLKTPRAITNEAATKVWSWDNVDPFGANAPNEDPDGDSNKFVFNLRFPGQYFDKETNTHYNYFRDYDPGQGRYVESDPVGLAGGINTYGYVSGNPIGSIDKRGLLTSGQLNILPDNHARATKAALAALGLTCTKLFSLPKAVSDVDSEGGSQSDASAYRHATRWKDQDPQAAIWLYSAYIQTNFKRCDIKGLANILHARQDSASRGHLDMPEYSGTKHFLGFDTGIPDVDMSHFIWDVWPRGTMNTAISLSITTIKDYIAKCPCICN